MSPVVAEQSQANAVGTFTKKEPIGESRNIRSTVDEDSKRKTQGIEQSAINDFTESAPLFRATGSESFPRKCLNRSAKM